MWRGERVPPLRVRNMTGIRLLSTRLDLAGKKGEVKVMVVTEGGTQATGDLVPAQCFPPGIEEIYEFAMVRLDEPTASRQAWMALSKPQNRGNLTPLQHIFPGETKWEARMFLVILIAVVGFTILVAWSFSKENAQQPIPEPHVG